MAVTSSEVLQNRAVRQDLGVALAGTAWMHAQTGRGFQLVLTVRIELGVVKLGVAKLGQDLLSEASSTLGDAREETSSIGELSSPNEPRVLDGAEGGVRRAHL